MALHGRRAQPLGRVMPLDTDSSAPQGVHVHSVIRPPRDDGPSERTVQTHRVGVSVESLLRREGGARVAGRGTRHRARRVSSLPVAPWMAGTAVAGVALAGAASAALLSDRPTTTPSAAGPGFHTYAVPPIPSVPTELTASAKEPPAPIADPAQIALLAQPGAVPGTDVPASPTAGPAAPTIDPTVVPVPVQRSAPFDTAPPTATAPASPAVTTAPSSTSPTYTPSPPPQSRPAPPTSVAPSPHPVAPPPSTRPPKPERPRGDQPPPSTSTPPPPTSETGSPPAEQPAPPTTEPPPPTSSAPEPDTPPADPTTEAPVPGE